MVNQILISVWILFIIGFSVAIYYISRPKNNLNFTPQPTFQPTVQPYNISNINPIYEINQGIGLKPNSFQFGFVNGLPVIQFCDNNMNYSLINFLIPGNDNINPSITTIPPKNQTSFIAPQMIDKNINVNYGLSVNSSFEIGLYNGYPAVNFINYKYVSYQLEFTLIPNTLSPGGYFFNYYKTNMTPSNVTFEPDFNKTNNILNITFSSNTPVIIEIQQNTLPVGYYKFTLMHLNLAGEVNPINLPVLLWRNNSGYNCIILLAIDNDVTTTYLPAYFFKLI